MAASHHPAIRFYFKSLYKPKKGSLSEFIDAFSKQNKTVTVVQIGANDGFNHDPIFKFIFRDNWNGVLLEPQPLVFHNFLKKLHAKNPLIELVNAAIDYHDGQKILYRVSFSDERWAHGLSGFKKDTLLKAYESGFIQYMASKTGTIVSDNDEWIKEEIVNCICPETLLELYHIKKIDWLQIDTEGFDFEVIKMFDLTGLKPSVISFEHTHLTSSDLNDCYTLLKAKGYKLLHFGGNTIARKV